jgi:hypothetical protein
VGVTRSGGTAATAAGLERARRHARPDNLTSLRRLDEELTRHGWLVHGRAVREWIADLGTLPYDASPVGLGQAEWQESTEWRMEPEWQPLQQPVPQSEDERDVHAPADSRVTVGARSRSGAHGTEP